MPAFTMRISQDEEEPFRTYLKMFNQDGRLIESIAPSDIKEVSPNAYSAFIELYDMARRTALRVDEALENILSELDRKE